MDGRLGDPVSTGSPRVSQGRICFAFYAELTGEFIKARIDSVHNRMDEIASMMKTDRRENRLAPSQGVRSSSSGGTSYEAEAEPQTSTRCREGGAVKYARSSRSEKTADDESEFEGP